MNIVLIGIAVIYILYDFIFSSYVTTNTLSFWRWSMLLFAGVCFFIIYILKKYFYENLVDWLYILGISSFLVILIFDFFTEMGLSEWLPKNTSIEYFWMGRSPLFLLIYLAAIYFIGRAKFVKISWKHIVVWLFSTVFFSFICLYVTMSIENPIHPIYCCGDMLITYWGWIYFWIECYGSDYCEMAHAKVSVVSMIFNLMFFANFYQIIIGLIGNFKISRNKSLGYVK